MPRRTIVSWRNHESRFRAISAFVQSLAGSSRYFRDKYRLLADPGAGAHRFELLQYQLAVAQARVRDRVVLDAGCGSGIHAVMFAALGATAIHALDFFPENVRALRRLAQHFDLPISPTVADASTLPYPVGSADLVFCTEAISHFENWKAFLVETHRVLKPGGRILISDWNNGANPFVRRSIHRQWELSERGPFTAETFPPGASLPYLFRRWMIIRRIFPRLGDDEVFQLGLRTSGHGGRDLLEICRTYERTGMLPSFVHEPGVSQRRPEDAQTNEEPLDPRGVARILSSVGVASRARPHFGYGRNRVMPALNALGAVIAPWAIKIAPAYLIVGAKKLEPHVVTEGESDASVTRDALATASAS
jgi:SAM-dependent methyltransferase